jgi:flavin-binding protein dodecin
MAIMKVIEILAESGKSWEDAARTAVSEASKTLHGIKSVWVKNFAVNVENGKITTWRVNCHVTFELDGNRSGDKSTKTKR